MTEVGTPLELAGVVGGGTMGAGIAHALLIAGYGVVLVDSSDGARRSAVERVHDALVESGRRDLLPLPASELGARLRTAGELTAVADTAMVIEAVPESVELKTDVLHGVSRCVGPGTVIATNTSSLSIDELAGTVENPERFVGMHFFNPVPASELVEIVRGAATSPGTLAIVHDAAARMGKTSIEVADSPGFATSRLGVALGLEAIRMVEEGVAAPADIDRAMVLGYKHPIGPLRLGDLVGLDIRLGIAEHLERSLGARFKPPARLREMVANGRLGKKTGQGFYSWP